MEQINTVELRDPNKYPDETVLQNILEDSYLAYKALLELYDSMGMVYEWKYYSDGKAWLCKVQKKKKTVIWMSAWKGYMQATIYIHDKDIEKFKSLDLRQEIKERIVSAKKVGKSLPVMFEIRDREVLKDIEKVALFKISLQ
jgi:hypothetical protein